jgi:hypothetical protein
MRRQFQIRFRRPVEYRFPLFPRCFVRIELQWHKIKGCPGVTTLVKNAGSDEPAHIADAVIDAMKAKERDGAIDLPNEKRGRKNPRVGDQVRNRARSLCRPLRALHSDLAPAGRRAVAHVQGASAGAVAPRRGRDGLTGRRYRIQRGVIP